MSCLYDSGTCQDNVKVARKENNPRLMGTGVGKIYGFQTSAR